MQYFFFQVFYNIYRMIQNIVCICTDDLSQDKVATQSTTAAGPPNAPNTFVASNAVDRDITTCMRTKGIGLTSKYMTEWWKVDLGGVYNIYSINILFKNYQGYGIVLLIVYYLLQKALFEQVLSFFIEMFYRKSKLIFYMVYMYKVASINIQTYTLIKWDILLIHCWS